MVKNIILFFLVIITIHISSCQRKNNRTNIHEVFNNQPDSSLVSSVNYAEGFDIYKIDNIKKLVIYNPQNHEEILSTLYFADSNIYYNYEPSPSFFKTPLDSVAVFSATQLNAFSKLNILDKVIGISESDFIQNPTIKKLYSENKIVELVSNGNFYLEKTLKLNPKIIYYSPYNLAQKHPLAATNITMIPFFDFMEANPLGRAEWLKFTALFFDKTNEADLIFDTIVTKYNNYKNLTDSITNRPTVFSDKYYSGQWFMSGGKSYIAQLYKDAGADYLWSDNQNTGGINIDFEVVFNKAHNADFWRIVGTYPNGFSYEKLLSENELYTNFSAFKNRNVIFCDSKSSTYFETGTLEPHLLLADLINVFHPEVLTNYNPSYYFLQR